MSGASVLVSVASEEVRAASNMVRARPLRVLTLSPFFPSAQDPGQGGFVAEPLAMMSSFGVSHEVIAAQPFYRRARQAQNPNALWEKYFSIPGNAGLAVAGKFLTARLMPGILRTHNQTPFDLIHAHAALPCGQAARIIASRLSVPFVVSVHGLDAFFTEQGGAIFGPWCEQAAKQVYQSASAVICISQKVGERVISRANADVTVIYNGVDVERFFPRKEAATRLTVLSIGNLIKIKGHASLLRAFAGLPRDVPDCSLHIIGDGPERGRLSQLATKLGLASRVQFSSPQGREYVAESMRQCALFALPSTFEGLGCVYLEAMACAKPVIGCRGQGIEEIIEPGETGMLVTPGNERELTDSMFTLLRDKELRRRMGENAREAVLDGLTLHHQAKRIADVYRRCAR